MIDTEINSIIVVKKKEKKINLFALFKKEKGEYEKTILNKKYKIDNTTLEELKNKNKIYIILKYIKVNKNLILILGWVYEFNNILV